MDIALESQTVLTQADCLRMTNMCLRLQQSGCVEEKRDLVFGLIMEIPRHADACGAVVLMGEEIIAVDRAIEPDRASMHKVMTFLFPSRSRN